jgi:hypothetical protein
MLARPLLLRHTLHPLRCRPSTRTAEITTFIRQRCYYTGSAAALSEPSEPLTEDGEESGHKENRKVENLKLRRNRSGHRFALKKANLGVNTLGKPAEVLILRNTEPSLVQEIEESRPTPSNLEEYYDEGTNIDSSADSVNQDILASINEENTSRAGTKAERQAATIPQLEKLRPQTAPGVPQPVLSRKEFETLKSKLEGFTHSQLNNYYNSAVANASASGFKKEGPRIEWWPWQPQKQGTWSILLGGHRSRRIVKFKSRDHAISTILRSLWEVIVQDEGRFSGHTWRTVNGSSLLVLSAGSQLLLIFLLELKLTLSRNESSRRNFAILSCQASTAY